MRSLTTGPDGEWVLARSGREVTALAAGAAPALGKMVLRGDDADLAIVNGPPNVVIAATRGSATTEVSLHAPPELEAVTRLELPSVARIATTCAGRAVMLSSDQRDMTIIRAAGRGLSAHAIDLQRKTVEFVVGLERNQLIVSLQGRPEVWDAISGRPLRKLALDLPPPPRTIGIAAGTLWAIRPSSDEVFAYRLSDGRPFRHSVGAPIEGVVSHPQSPVLVFITPRGLIRLHCFSHSVLAIDCPWRPESPVPLAQFISADDFTLLGWPEGTSEPWRAAIGGAGPQTAHSATTTAPIAQTRASEPTGSSERWGSGSAGLSGPGWREELAAFGHEAVRGTPSTLPAIAIDTELDELARHLTLTASARRAITAMYAFYLVGSPKIAIASLARMIGDWSEPLGQGQLAALAMLNHSDGNVCLAPQVSDVLDGRPPREIRLVGNTATAPRGELFQLVRNGRHDSALETELATQFGRIGVVESPHLAAAILEARLRGATGVSFVVPTQRPRPWPHGASLVTVVDAPVQSGWLSNAPTL